MKKFNRELLVLLTENTGKEEIEHEVELLHEILFDFEQTERLIISHELIDVNKRRITSSPKKLRAIFKSQELKPFIFLNSLN